ncbi:MFS transporter [Saccharopolyspora rosea]|uniref:MFS transporter n=1 Tax=Saccharopolyspora rosea TaxID=524884 RepID=A0ABW3FWT9_9PSEU|nr:MFS transporter [Saccharopolyspora rosea]
MDRTERRTFWACFGGWATDAADVQVYSLLIPILLSTRFLHNNAQAGAIGTATLLASAVGGWLAGMLADRYGRVRMLQLTVLWFSVFTLLCGLAQDPVQLGVLRALMGLGFGGEWAIGAVLMAETVRPSIRGRAVGTVQSGWAVGWAVAVGLFVLVAALLPPEWTWRVLFGLGVLPALLVFYLRRSVPEPALARGEHARLRETLRIFAPALIRHTLLCCVLGIGAQGGYYALTTWLPQFLSSRRGLNVYGLGATLALIIGGAFVGYLLGAWLTDGIGRRSTILVTSVGAFLIVIPFVLLNTGTAVFTLLCFPLGVFSSAYFSAIGPLLSEQFPTEVRATGQAFAYNFGRGIGALFPLAVGILADRVGIALAIALFAGAAYAVLAISAMFVQERRDVPLDRIAV